MERSKVRDTDNLRTFFLSRFFVDYLLILREKALAAIKSPPAVNGGEQPEKPKLDASVSLGLVAEMAEIDTVRWVVVRMKTTMDEKVSLVPKVNGFAETS